MAEVDRDGVEVDQAFLDGAGGHMCLIAAPVEGVALRAEPAPHVAFRPLAIGEAAEAYYGLRIGGLPTLDPILDQWMADVRLRGERVALLFQVPAHRKFPRLPTAPSRADYLLPPDQPGPADPEQAYYEIGNGGVLFAFGSAVGRADGYLVARHPIGGR